MAKYIDQDDLLGAVEQIMYEYRDDPAMALVEIVSTIEDWGHPLVDPEIVKHGKWRKKHISDCDFWVCPICGSHSPTAYPPHYCFGCGAQLEVLDNG